MYQIVKGMGRVRYDILVLESGRGMIGISDMAEMPLDRAGEGSRGGM